MAQGLSERLLVYPGAFSAPLHCIVRRDNSGAPEFVVFELVPQADGIVSIGYRPDRIAATVGPPDAEEATFIYCFAAENDEYACQVDVFMGSNAWLRRYWSADTGDLVAARFYVYADDALVDADIAEAFSEAEPDGREVALSMPDADLYHAKDFIADNPRGDVYSLTDADTLYGMMDALDEGGMPVIVEFGVVENGLIQGYRARQNPEILATIMNYLGHLEFLMFHGPDGSRDIRF